MKGIDISTFKSAYVINTYILLGKIYIFLDEYIQFIPNNEKSF